jgi:6-methylsalicylate decarboxylase
MERRAAVVFVHPTSSPDAAARTLGLPDSLIDFTADTTRAVAQLHYGNTFVRTPNVKYIFSHAGGTIPYLATRFSYLRRDLAVSCRSEVESSAELQANEARAVLAGNAFKLFPRFAGHAATQTTNTA